jgi:hypothetical protein
MNTISVILITWTLTGTRIELSMPGLIACKAVAATITLAEAHCIGNVMDLLKERIQDDTCMICRLHRE